ncbi:TrkH family potassium uptake protein [Bacillus sp. 03113]|uniref:TrkH family potassium uptake protein n=1 Tax=Bacillus sp. 03113 TaxID=2578211 RepID=UPI0011421D49|nr:TrkH family potassium uptake protein [Bacillus sp. 03113]
MKRKNITMNPAQLLIFIFLIFILIGTALLKLPFATTETISWLDALFTTTSAMTVTGLVVFDTATVYTYFGEIVIMCLIQLGGLGIMSFAILIYMMLGKKIGFKERLLLQQALNQTSIGGVIRLVRNLFIFSFTIELVAVILLSVRWVPQFGWAKGIYYSFFHSISAFNNAGFALWEDGLSQFVGDPAINLIISLLIVVGGIGFTVLADLIHAKNFQQLSLHSKLMIIGTLVINVVSIIIIFSLEYNNTRTIAQLPLSDKIWASYFQGISPRTAGFNTIDMTGIEDPTAFFMLFLMFVGAGSGSTGGGIKLTTFIIMILAVITFTKGKKEIVLFRRSIHPSYVLKTLTIAMISIMAIFIAVFILSITEKAPFIKIIFEVISAFGTVGLSMGITSSLSVIGKLVIILVMFIGKLGPLTLAFSLAKPSKEKIRYPNEDVLTG